MNIEASASIFGTDGLSFPCSFDDCIGSIPANNSRRAKDVIFRSDFPGSKKMTIVNPKKEKPKNMSWDDIYENRVSKISSIKEPPCSFIDDPFTDETKRQRQTNMSKQRITLTGDLVKARTIDKSRLPRNAKGLNKNTGEEHAMKDLQIRTQTEPIVVDWCRTANPNIIKQLTDASQGSEVTSTTSATSFSGEYNDILHKRRNDMPKRCVSRSKTVGGTPSRRMNTDMLNVDKTNSKESFSRGDFEVNWPSANKVVANRESIYLSESKNDVRNPAPKRAISTSRNTRRTSMIGASSVADTSTAEHVPSSTNRRESLDNHQHAASSNVKPRIYMSVSSPRKTINMKCADQCPNDMMFLKNNLPKLDSNFYNAFDGKKSKSSTAAINSEPLDFSEFDTEDFSSSDDIIEDFSMPFKPVEPFYTKSSKSKAYIKSSEKDAEEEAWSALFSPPFG